MSTVKIFVRLKREGPDVWRSTTAHSLGDGVYEILGIARPGEKWEYAPGSKVGCEQRRFEDGSMGLVAARLKS